jgi:hypothetical protein
MFSHTQPQSARVTSVGHCLVISKKCYLDTSTLPLHKLSPSGCPATVRHNLNLQSFRSSITITPSCLQLPTTWPPRLLTQYAVASQTPLLPSPMLPITSNTAVTPPVGTISSLATPTLPLSPHSQSPSLMPPGQSCQRRQIIVHFNASPASNDQLSPRELWSKVNVSLHTFGVLVSSAKYIEVGNIAFIPHGPSTPSDLLRHSDTLRLEIASAHERPTSSLKLEPDTPWHNVVMPDVPWTCKRNRALHRQKS